FSFNYRNEPIFPRIFSSTGAPTAQDLSYVYRSEPRTLPGETATPPYTKPLTPGVQPEDPFTPLLRAYAGDDVQVRIVVGAHQNPHNFNINDLKWLFEPSNVNSGWRNTQTMGISEHFEFLLQVPPALSQPNPQTPDKPWRDYLYRSTAARKGQASGNWGLFRAYDKHQPDLFPLPGVAPAHQPIPVCPAKLMNVDCGTKVGLHTLQCYTVIATSAADVFASSGKPLTYNTKLNLTTQNAILYLLKKDYDAIKASPPQFAPGFDIATGQAEPMVLRAAAGDCIKVNLVNKLSSATTMGGGANANQLPVAGTSAADRDLFAASKVSQNVGLHPQLVSFDVAQSDADNVGWNPVQTAPPGGKMTYYWYAGNIDPKRAEPHVPVEFGAANLLPSDVMNHHGYGMFAGLVVEPEGATWKTDPASGDSATVTLADGKTTFREFVLFLQDDTAGSGFGGFNLKSELLNPFATLSRTCSTSAQGVSCVLSNAAVCNGGACGYSPDVPIQTPLFCAEKGQQARIRLLHPGGAVTNNVFELYGHAFAEEPYSTKPASCAAPMTRPNLEAGQVIAADHNQCPDGNLALGPTVSEWKGSRMGHGPTNHYDLVIASAGGAGKVPGDYLYRSFPADRFSAGIWGIFRVTDGDPAKNPKVCPTFYQP
ncbi:MAG TPA: hypothetical protein VOA87_16270, partial [Thermoanaerobaculia bacterium]|nr:hypothetical protein [Thermoanaerobaculia bacterium]